jgi:hypothetical protein
VAEFADGQITRMTVWSANGKPDLGRGIKLAYAALESRKRVARLRQRGGQDEAESSTDLPEKCELPAITALHFEAVDGESVITTKFTADQIAEATHDQ